MVHVVAGRTQRQLRDNPPNIAVEPTPAASAPASLRLSARLTASVGPEPIHAVPFSLPDIHRSSNRITHDEKLPVQHIPANLMASVIIFDVGGVLTPDIRKPMLRTLLAERYPTHDLAPFWTPHSARGNSSVVTRHSRKWHFGKRLSRQPDWMRRLRHCRGGFVRGSAAILRRLLWRGSYIGVGISLVC